MSYEEFVAKRTKKSTEIFESFSPAKANLMHAALLIAGEAGELVDCIKKHIVYGQELDLENLVEEMGDIEFGLAMLRNQLCMSRETIISANESKLSKRYPDGYSDSKAKERADKQETSEEEELTEEEKDIVNGLSNLFSLLKSIVEEKEKESNLDLVKRKLSKVLEIEHPLLEVGNTDPLTIEFVVVKNSIKDIDYVVVGSHIVQIEGSLTPDLNDYVYFMSRKVQSLNNLIKDRLETSSTFKCKLEFTEDDIEITLEGDN